MRIIIAKKCELFNLGQRKNAAIPVRAATLIPAYSVVFGQLICPLVRLPRLLSP